MVCSIVFVRSKFRIWRAVWERPKQTRERWLEDTGQERPRKQVFRPRVLLAVNITVVLTSWFLVLSYQYHLAALQRVPQAVPFARFSRAVGCEELKFLLRRVWLAKVCKNNNNAIRRTFLGKKESVHSNPDPNSIFSRPFWNPVTQCLENTGKKLPFLNP